MAKSHVIPADLSTVEQLSLKTKGISKALQLAYKEAFNWAKHPDYPTYGGLYTVEKIIKKRRRGVLRRPCR